MPLKQREQSSVSQRGSHAGARLHRTGGTLHPCGSASSAGTERAHVGKRGWRPVVVGAGLGPPCGGLQVAHQAALGLIRRIVAAGTNESSLECCGIGSDEALNRLILGLGLKLTRLRGVSAGLGDYGSVVMSSLAVSKAMGDR